MALRLLRMVTRAGDSKKARNGQMVLTWRWYVTEVVSALETICMVFSVLGLFRSIGPFPGLSICHDIGAAPLRFPV